MRNSKDEKIKRPGKSLYVIPAMRSKFSKKCEDKMEYSKGQIASEVANRQDFSLGKHESSQRRYTNIDPRRVLLDSSSSSSNPKNTLEESCKDYDSSDFEESDSDSASMNNLKIRNETDEDNSNDHWKKGGGRERPTKNDHGIEIKNYENDTKISNKFLMQHKSYSDLKSLSNEGMNSESYEKKFGKGLFYNSGDSNNSDIESISDSYTKKGSVLTSAPNSDIVEERVLDTDKYIPLRKSAMESTLLDQSDSLTTTINTNRNDCVYNFAIHSDPPSVKKQPTCYSEIIGNNYKLRPVPPPRHLFRLPTIHRLPSPVSTSYELSVPRPVSCRPSVPRLVSPRQSIFHPVSPRSSVRHSVSSQPSIFHPLSSWRSVPRLVSSRPPKSRPARLKVPRPLSSRPSVSGYVSS